MSIKQNKYLYNILYVYKLSNSCLSILTSSYSSSWGEYNFNITPVLITLYISDLTSAHLTDPQDFTVYRSHRYKRFYSLQISHMQQILLVAQVQILKNLHLQILHILQILDILPFTDLHICTTDFTLRLNLALTDLTASGELTDLTVYK